MSTTNDQKVRHGGDWAGFFEERGHFPLDFSANVSPLGLPRPAREAIAALLSDDSSPDRISCPELAAYPDPACRALRRAIAARYGVLDWQIFCANGAADIIYRLAYALYPARALLVAPDFREYAGALLNVGTTIEYYEMCKNADRQTDISGGDNMSGEETGWTITEDILHAIGPGTDLVIFSNPNNPSGTAADIGLLDRILDKCISCGALLVVDECFMDFLPDASSRTMLQRLHNAEGHLLVLRAFTKFYGMAGLRLGWCAASDPALPEKLQRFGPPWQVSAIAQAAGIAALSDRDYETELRGLILGERVFLTDELRSRGYKVVPGTANYILFYSADHSLHERLRSRGIMIRDCSDYLCLGPGWYRTAVRLHQENEILLRFL